MEISVIVITYNQERTIGRTLDSILAQRTDVDFEIIIGDDASADGTETICRRYAVAHPGKIIYLRRDRNLGVVRNYYDCVSRGRGRYLADCAGDDFWTDPLKLQRQWEIISRSPDVSLVATHWRCCDPDGSNVRDCPGLPAPTRIMRYPAGTLCASILARRKTIHLCTALWRRDLLADAMRKAPDMFTNPDFSCEDLQILLAMAASGTIVMLPDVTLHYTVGHDSISHRKDYRSKFDYSIRTLRQTQALQRHFGVGGTEMDSYYRRETAALCSKAFRSGDPSRMRRFRIFAHENGFRPSFKSRIYLFIASFRFLWRWMLTLPKFRS